MKPKIVLLVFSFISFSCLSINADTLALSMEKYEQVQGIYRTRDSSRRELDDGYYVSFNKGEGKYEVGKIENSRRSGLWIICNEKYPDIKYINYYFGDTVFLFLVEFDTLVVNYEFRVYSYAPENFDGLFTPNFSSIIMDFDEGTHVTDFKLMVIDHKRDWMIHLGEISLNLGWINYDYLKRLFEDGG